MAIEGRASDSEAAGGSSVKLPKLFDRLSLIRRLDTKPHCKWVLTVLMLAAGDGNECYAGLTRLAAETGYSRRQLQRHIDALVRAKAITVVRNGKRFDATDGKPLFVNLVSLNWSIIAELPTVSGCDTDDASTISGCDTEGALDVTLKAPGCDTHDTQTQLEHNKEHNKLGAAWPIDDLPFANGHEYGAELIDRMIDAGKLSEKHRLRVMTLWVYSTRKATKSPSAYFKRLLRVGLDTGEWPGGDADEIEAEKVLKKSRKPATFGRNIFKKAELLEGYENDD